MSGRRSSRSQSRTYAAAAAKAATTSANISTSAIISPSDLLRRTVEMLQATQKFERDF
jgi:hypothetical protein